PGNEQNGKNPRRNAPPSRCRIEQRAPYEDALDDRCDIGPSIETFESEHARSSPRSVDDEHHEDGREQQRRRASPAPRREVPKATVTSDRPDGGSRQFESTRFDVVVTKALQTGDMLTPPGAPPHPSGG